MVFSPAFPRVIGPVFDRGMTFVPSDIANLTAWYKADAISGLSDADAIAQWDDSSGNGYHATQENSGRRPLYKTNIQNGLAVVRFDGTDDQLGHVIEGSTLANHSVFAVAIDNKNTTNYVGIFSSKLSSGNGMMMLAQIGSSNRWGTYDTTYADEPANSDFYNQGWKILAMIGTNSSGGDFRINGAGDGTYLGTEGQPWIDTGTPATTPAHIGGRSGAGGSAQQMNGDIAEILVYSRVLGGTEIGKVESYLSSKWGITIS